MVAKITDGLDTLLEFYKYSSGTLDPSAHHASDRINLCHSAFEEALTRRFGGLIDRFPLYAPYPLDEATRAVLVEGIKRGG